MVEALRLAGFSIEVAIPRFLPYTMSGKKEAPIWAIRAYLALPFVWRFIGKQFLVVARRPSQ
jgi:hypothetical protein